MRDPINELVHDLQHYGKPSLAWVLRWSAGGNDPVAEAWNRSRDPHAMFALLQRAEHSSTSQAQRVLHAPLLFDDSDRDVVRSDALRSLVPIPPSIEQVLR